MKQITLNIGGEERVFYFGLGFLGNLLEKENIQLQDIEAKLLENSYKWMPLIMYHSLAFGFIRKNEPVLFDAFDVAEWIDDLTEFEETEVIVPNKITGENEKVKVQIQVAVRYFFKAFWESINKNVPEDKKKALPKKK